MLPTLPSLRLRAGAVLGTSVAIVLVIATLSAPARAAGGPDEDQALEPAVPVATPVPSPGGTDPGDPADTSNVDNLIISLIGEFNIDSAPLERTILELLLYPGSGCSVDAFSPTKNGRFIYGKGGTGCPNRHPATYSEACLWKKRWYGWQKVSCDFVTEPQSTSATSEATTVCDGTWTWRTVAHGWILANDGRIYTAGNFEDIAGFPRWAC